jgi:hypothetical protein
MQGHILELPEDIYEALLQVSEEEGLTPPDWIAARLPLPLLRRNPATQSVSDANARLRQLTVSLGYPTGSNNESIDADLARAYADQHTDTGS